MKESEVSISLNIKVLLIAGVLTFFFGVIPALQTPEKIATNLEVKPVLTSHLSGIKIRYINYRGVKIPLSQNPDKRIISQIERKLGDINVGFYEKDLGRTDSCYVYLYDVKYLGGIYKKENAEILISAYPLQNDVMNIFLNQEKKETTKS